MNDGAVRVLVVDDDFMVGRVHRRFVARLDGFVVVGEARTGAEAISAAERLEPDLIMLDVYLPDISGIDVLASLQNRPHHADVVVITAARDASTVSEALRLGASDYLIKPFTFEAFSERVRRVVRQRSLRQVGGPDRSLDQQDVDEVFGGPAARASRLTLPKGLSDDTMELIRHHLRLQRHAESATEFGARVGLSRVSARRYLQHLASTTGEVRVTLRYGNTGRPERRYERVAGPDDDCPNWP